MSEFEFVKEGDDFDLFWESYPRKVAKVAALKSWKRIKPSITMRQIIMTALEFHKQQEGWQKDNGKFIPHAATWLNQHRWEDELKLNPSQKKISDEEKARIAQRIKERDAYLLRCAEKDMERKRAGVL